MDNEEYENARQKAFELLSQRDHTVHELKEKLRQRRFGDVTVTRLVSELLERKYLDDRRAVENYLRHAGQQGHHSLHYLKNKLSQKGISVDFTDKILQETPDIFNEEAVLERALQKAGKASPQKKMARLMRNGFPFALVKRKLKMSSEEQNEF